VVALAAGTGTRKGDGGRVGVGGGRGVGAYIGDYAVWADGCGGYEIALDKRRLRKQAEKRGRKKK